MKSQEDKGIQVYQTFNIASDIKQNALNGRHTLNYLFIFIIFLIYIIIFHLKYFTE